MTATLERRLTRLETTVPPPPPEPPADADQGWWEAAPPPVVRYYEAIWDEVTADPRYPADLAAAVAAAHARHPALSEVQAAIGRQARWGVPYTLRQVQRVILVGAASRLAFAAVARAGGAHGPDADREAYDRLLGIPAARLAPPDPARPTGGACYYDRSSETFVRQWRATGTTDPATRALAGLYAAELALLAADD